MRAHVSSRTGGNFTDLSPVVRRLDDKGATITGREQPDGDEVVVLHVDDGERQSLVRALHKPGDFGPSGERLPNLELVLDMVERNTHGDLIRGGLTSARSDLMQFRREYDELCATIERLAMHASTLADAVDCDGDAVPAAQDIRPVIAAARKAIEQRALEAFDVKRGRMVYLVVDDYALACLLCTATENRIDWCTPYSLEITRREKLRTPHKYKDGVETFATEVTFRNSETDEWHVVNLDTMRKGVQLFIQRMIEEEPPEGERIHPSALHDSLAGLDRVRAQLIMQLGLFGKERYA